jgi:hypothetical protein
MPVSGYSEILRPFVGLYRLKFAAFNLITKNWRPLCVRTMTGKHSQPTNCSVPISSETISQVARDRNASIDRQAYDQEWQKNVMLHHARDSYNKLICENVRKKILKKELLKKIAAMPFHAAEVRASMPTSRKKNSCTTQCSVLCVAQQS